MSVSRRYLSGVLCFLVLIATGGAGADIVELDIDGPIAAAVTTEAREALEQECIAVLGSDAEWPELYRAVRILAVVGSARSVAPLAAMLDNPRLAHLARLALETIPGDEAQEALLAALDGVSAETRMGLIASLTFKGGEAAVERLVALLDEDDVDMLHQASVAIGKLGVPPTAESLKPLLASDNALVRVAAAEALLSLAEQMSGLGLQAEAGAIYDTLFGNEWPEFVRAGAFMGMLNTQADNGLESVLTAMGGDDEYMRTVAIAAVAGLKGEGVTAFFTSRMTHFSPEIQAALLESLSRRNETLPLPVLFAALNGETEALRIAAMRALAEHGDATAIEPLAQRLPATDSRQEKQAIIETLRRLPGGDVDAALTAYMRTAPIALRSDLVDALVQRYATTAVDALIEQTRETEVRAAAFRGLGQLAGPEHVDTLLGLLMALEGDQGRNEAEAALVALCRESVLVPGELVVERAVYGNLPDGDYVDVTRRVARKVEAGALSVVAGNDEFGDPAPNAVKKLQVEYTANGVEGSLTVAEGNTLKVAADSIPAESFGTLARALDEASSVEAKASLLRVFSRLGGRAAYEVVARHLDDGEPAVHDAAVRALSSWPDAAAVDALVVLFSEASDAAHRGLALRGCVRLLRLGELPAPDTVAVYTALVDAGRTADERKLILSGLSDVAHVGAVKLAYPMLDDAEVRAEATSALERIKGVLGEEVYDAAVAEFASASSSPVVDDEHLPIFDGETLANWSGDPALWRVEDGCIVGETSEDSPVEYNTFLVFEGFEVENFDLKFRYRIDSEWVNSGVQIRSERFDTWRVRGYQPDIASEDWITGICYEEGGRGILARRGQKVEFDADGEARTTAFGEENALGDYLYQDDWNDYHVRAVGNRFYTRINGHKMHEVVDDAPQARRRGVIAFQLHTGPAMRIRFADIMVRRLPSDDSN